MSQTVGGEGGKNESDSGRGRTKNDSDSGRGRREE